MKANEAHCAFGLNPSSVPAKKLINGYLLSSLKDGCMPPSPIPNFAYAFPLQSPPISLQFSAFTEVHLLGTSPYAYPYFLCSQSFFLELSASLILYFAPLTDNNQNLLIAKYRNYWDYQLVANDKAVQMLAFNLLTPLNQRKGRKGTQRA